MGILLAMSVRFAVVSISSFWCGLLCCESTFRLLGTGTTLPSAWNGAVIGAMAGFVASAEATAVASDAVVDIAVTADTAIGLLGSNTDSRT